MQENLDSYLGQVPKPILCISMSLSCEIGFWRKILISTLARSESPFLWIPISQLLTRVVQENLHWQESRLLSWYIFFGKFWVLGNPFRALRIHILTFIRECVTERVYGCNVHLDSISRHENWQCSQDACVPLLFQFGWERFLDRATCFALLPPGLCIIVIKASVKLFFFISHAYQVCSKIQQWICYC